jgi:hypothetical protein
LSVGYFTIIQVAVASPHPSRIWDKVIMAGAVTKRTGVANKRLPNIITTRHVPPEEVGGTSILKCLALDSCEELVHGLVCSVFTCSTPEYNGTEIREPRATLDAATAGIIPDISEIASFIKTRNRFSSG